MMKGLPFHLATLLLLGGCATTGGVDVAAKQALLASGQPADGWITAAGLEPNEAPVVLNFQRKFELAAKPSAFLVDVTADNRFILYVNGARVASGPSTGDIAHWRVERIDLAPYLDAGSNTIAARVWNGVKPIPVKPDATDHEKEMARGRALITQTAPLFQQSVATGFRLLGTGEAAAVSTDRAGWEAARDAGHGMSNGWVQLKRYYYVAGAPEIIDAERSPWGNEDAQADPSLAAAVPAPAAASRTLVRDRLPQQSFDGVDAGKVVRTDLPAANGFPQTPVTIPARSKVSLLIDRGTMVSAYPQFMVDGGAGAKLTVTYSEALYDEKGNKGDRNLVGDRKILGLSDKFIADGSRYTFAPLWWRTWRYMEIAVDTADEPIKLDGLKVFQTGYPFQQVAKFVSDDSELNRIFDIGWRTARIDAHETYQDTAYWEQLQYVGDTRLQMLISYAASGDPRLAENAIDLIAASRGPDGLVEGAYPTRSPNVIATFAPLWVGMLADWRMQQPDPAPIVRNLPRMREILAWVDKWQAPSGLLTKNPEWNFIDWAGQPSTDRDQFPSFARAGGESCLNTVLWLGAVKQGAEIERQLGDPAQGRVYADKAAAMRTALRERCWSEQRGLFADNPDLDLFSQHMNALAVLYDVATPDEAKAILGRITVPGQGIDAPEGMREASYYFAWYLVRAFEHAGEGERYLDLLKTWRDLLALNYTTWPEERGRTRSDTHAWSAHPTADLLGIVAGIQPGSAGYRTVRIEPHLGNIKSLDATAATPLGPVTVHYRIQGGYLLATVVKPKSLSGVLVWRGREHPLRLERTKIQLSLQ